MPSPSFEGQAPRPPAPPWRTARLGQCAVSRAPRISAVRRTSFDRKKNPLTRDRPQACEPRCADVFKHYLACADRIEQKGAGAGAASLNTNRHRTPSPRPHEKNAQATASPTTSTGSSA